MALTRYTEVGNRKGAAQSWFDLGRIWLKFGNVDNAREAMQNSLKSWLSVPEGIGKFRQDALLRCEFYLRRLSDGGE